MGRKGQNKASTSSQQRPRGDSTVLSKTRSSSLPYFRLCIEIILPPETDRSRRILSLPASIFPNLPPVLGLTERGEDFCLNWRLQLVTPDTGASAKKEPEGNNRGESRERDGRDFKEKDREDRKGKETLLDGETSLYFGQGAINITDMDKRTLFTVCPKTVATFPSS